MDFKGYSEIKYLRLRRLINETEEEKKYREAREALIQWSSQFWLHHNILFYKKKAEFVEQVQLFYWKYFLPIV